MRRRLALRATGSRVLAILLAPILLIGCYGEYLTRSAYEEGRILWHRKPIDDALARSDLPERDSRQAGNRAGGAQVRR